MKFRSLLLSGAAGTAAILAGCGGNDSQPASTTEPEPAEIQRVTQTGQTAAKALMESLGGQLKGALQSGGPVQALQICQQAAQPLTAAAGAQFEGVGIRRTTLKPRNPANAPDPIDRAILEKMAATSPPAAMIEWQETVARYYQPLVIQEVCLNCHGDPKTFAPALANALAERYPIDLATGYALGDFRGVIRVDIDRP